ncbi:MAG: hypothetical protein KGZ30_00770 [Anaplasmataceae bacterium]|nr:hypothetical protein [Anaplasmataceae bacterium]
MTSVSRNDIHHQAVTLIMETIGRILEANGTRVIITPAESRLKPYDLLVDGHRVTIRGAMTSVGPHQVTVGGRCYQYNYRSFHFNLHVRKKPIDTDFVVCACLEANGGRKLVLRDFFAFPRSVYPGKVFSLHVGRGSYHGRLVSYRNTWQGLISMLHHKPPQETQVS